MDYPFTDIESFQELSDLHKKEKQNAEIKRQRVERFSLVKNAKSKQR